MPQRSSANEPRADLLATGKALEPFKHSLSSNISFWSLVSYWYTAGYLYR